MIRSVELPLDVLRQRLTYAGLVLVAYESPRSTRILLDENLPHKLVAHLRGHECRTVVQCGWSGKKNGELLALADPQFDILLALDKNLPYQQYLNTKRIAVLIVRARSNRIQDLVLGNSETILAAAGI